MQNFKVGDRIRCVITSDKDDKGCQVTQGYFYRISGLSKEFLKVVGQGSAEWFKYRFVKTHWEDFYKRLHDIDTNIS